MSGALQIATSGAKLSMEHMAFSASRRPWNLAYISETDCCWHLLIRHTL